ncbi:MULTISPECIES: hypothetical protein [unclassified Streptomyces]|uniref:hypothetical protein n=1 Tax=unclassified Streptomyces TaxID=2593676 RepID=UPI000476DADE|nr:MULTISPECIES: hypothetical protein [unclassified Streptomyces]MYX35347.1 hypothetical protein [Streptomyces sp. SID8377]
MADIQSSAPSRARAGTPAAGVVHVRRRLTANFTILSNRLAQRPGSAVTVGVGAYLLSVPDGVPVSIDALRAHFTESRERLARALNELEAEGFLERVVVREENGRIRTRTYVHDVPRADAPAAPDGPAAAPAPAPTPPAPVVPAGACEEAPGTAPEAVPDGAAPGAHPLGAHPLGEDALGKAAEAVLVSLRVRDSRLLLSRRDIARLSPGVAAWLRLGADPRSIAEALAADLPPALTHRPAGLLAYRLRTGEPPAAVPPPRAAVPWQACDSCERPFRGHAPATCRECLASAA